MHGHDRPGSSSGGYFNPPRNNQYQYPERPYQEVMAPPIPHMGAPPHYPGVYYNQPYAPLPGNPPHAMVPMAHPAYAGYPPPHIHPHMHPLPIGAPYPLYPIPEPEGLPQPHVRPRQLQESPPPPPPPRRLRNGESPPPPPPPRVPRTPPPRRAPRTPSLPGSKTPPSREPRTPPPREPRTPPPRESMAPITRRPPMTPPTPPLRGTASTSSPQPPQPAQSRRSERRRRDEERRSRRPTNQRAAPHEKRSISQGPGQNNGDWGAIEYGKYAERIASTQLKRLHLDRGYYKHIMRMVANAAKVYRWDDRQVRAHVFNGYRFYRNGDDQDGARQFQISLIVRPPTPHLWLVDNEIRSTPPSPVYRPAEPAASPLSSFDDEAHDHGEGPSNRGGQLFEAVDDQIGFYRRLLADFAAQGRQFGQPAGEIPAIYNADGMLTEWGYELHLVNQARQAAAQLPLVHYEEVGFDRDDDAMQEPDQSNIVDPAEEERRLQQAQQEAEERQRSIEHARQEGRIALDDDNEPAPSFYEYRPRRGPRTPSPASEQITFSPGHIRVGPRTPPPLEYELMDFMPNRLEPAIEIEGFPMDPEHNPVDVLQNEPEPRPELQDLILFDPIPMEPEPVFQNFGNAAPAEQLQVEEKDAVKTKTCVDHEAPTDESGIADETFALKREVAQRAVSKRKKDAVPDINNATKRKKSDRPQETPEDGEIVETESAEGSSSLALINTSSNDDSELNSITSAEKITNAKFAKKNNKILENGSSSSSSDERLVHSQSPPTPQITTEISSTSSGETSTSTLKAFSEPSTGASKKAKKNKKEKKEKKEKERKDKKENREKSEERSKQRERLADTSRSRMISSANDSLRNHRANNDRRGNHFNRRRSSHGPPRQQRNSYTNGHQQGLNQKHKSSYSLAREQEIKMHLDRMERSRLEQEEGERPQFHRTEFSHFAHDTSGRNRERHAQINRDNRTRQSRSRPRQPSQSRRPTQSSNRRQRSPSANRRQRSPEKHIAPAEARQNNRGQRGLDRFSAYGPQRQQHQPIQRQQRDDRPEVPLRDRIEWNAEARPDRIANAIRR